MAQKADKHSAHQALVADYRKGVDGIKSYFEALLPHKGALERFIQLSYLAVTRNPDLLSCNRRSLLLALLWCAQKDLEVGVDDGAWLVPFKTLVVPVPAYKGLIKKAVETESARDVDA